MHTDNSSFYIFITALLLGCSLYFSQPVMAAQLQQPDCRRLLQWAGSYQPKETVQLTPKVTISRFMQDNITAPLFGKGVSDWDRRDFSQARSALNNCRRTALKNRDKKTARVYYNAMTGLSQASAPLTRMIQNKQLAQQKVKWIIDFQKVPELPTLLELAQRSLKGEDVRSELSKIRLRSQITDHVASLRQARDYLTESETSDMIERLAKRETVVRAEMQQNATAMNNLQQQLATVPNNSVGLNKLAQLSQSPALKEVSRQEANAFQREIQTKRWAIQRAMRQQAVRTAAVQAATPVSVVQRFNELLPEKDVEDVSINGIRPGISYQQAKNKLANEWHFATGAGGDLFKFFGPINRDVERYKKQYHRDGGIFEFKTMRGKIGKVHFVEHYTSHLKTKELLTWLDKRYGRPEKSQNTSNGPMLSWEDDGTHLQITVRDNIVEDYRFRRGYHSSVVINIVSDDYLNYLKEADEHCRELRNKPVSELSIADKQAVLNGCKTP